MLVSSLGWAIAPEQSPYAALSQLARVLVLVENHYVEPVERTRLLEGAIKGMVAELDPHSAYLPPEDFKLFQTETQGSFVGVGIEVDARNETITVIAPIEGSPAARAGIRSGDRIIAVDGRTTRSQPLDRVVRMMRGAPGSMVKLTVQRPGLEEVLELTLQRASIHVASVVGQRLEGDIVYVRIKQFQQGTHAELLQVLGAIRQQSTRALAGAVLDLRTNPGGLVDEASAIADELLDSGTIYTTRRRGRIEEEVSARAGGALARLPLVVLVNEYSASAAELLAGALQDQHRSVVVGATTFGKGSVQSVLELPGGSGLKLTTMLYYTPSGRSIQAEGIHPDVLVQSGSTAGSGLPVLRERDIEGHLPSPNPEQLDAGGALQQSADAAAHSGQDPLLIGPRVPFNPTGGQDLALSVGYQILRGVVSGTMSRTQPAGPR